LLLRRQNRFARGKPFVFMPRRATLHDPAKRDRVKRGNHIISLIIKMRLQKEKKTLYNAMLSYGVCPVEQYEEAPSC
jgi:hypothetical protein